MDPVGRRTFGVESGMSGSVAMRVQSLLLGNAGQPRLSDREAGSHQHCKLLDRMSEDQMWENKGQSRRHRCVRPNATATCQAQRGAHVANTSPNPCWSRAVLRQSQVLEQGEGGNWPDGKVAAVG
eukprot:EG_transcript_27049